jgi:uncharacterized protein (DUF58 family)
MRPAPALVAACVGCALIGALVVFDLLPFAAFFSACAVLLLLGAVDAWRLRGLITPLLERDLPPVVPVGIEGVVTLRLRHQGSSPLSIEVHDLHPGDWPVFGLPHAVMLPVDRELEVLYRITPTERGTFSFEGCALLLGSPLRLWRQRRTVSIQQSLRVYPNFAPLAKLALIGAEQASRVVGAHLHRRRGEGTEFQQLREYRTGDSLRQIDWKASQRARKLISRDYQDERNQQVMLLLDTGRRLLARDGTLTHFDHVLNASLMLAYMALRQGDAVGLLASDVLLDTLFDLDAQPVATDYLEVATQLSMRQSRRSLVVLITNVRDEDIDDLLAAVRQMQRRHLVCVASLREHVLDQVLTADVQDFSQAVTAAAMAQYIEQRTRAHQLLRARGIDVLDVSCAELPAALVQHYLSIKRSARL